MSTSASSWNENSCFGIQTAIIMTDHDNIMTIIIMQV